MKTLMTRLGAGVAAFALVCLGVLGASASASAHTPTAQADCTSLYVSLTNYQPQVPATPDKNVPDGFEKFTWHDPKVAPTVAPPSDGWKSSGRTNDTKGATPDKIVKQGQGNGSYFYYKSLTKFVPGSPAKYNTVEVRIDGNLIPEGVISFGTAFNRAFALGDKYVAHNWSVKVVAYDAPNNPQWSPTLSGTSTPCVPPGQPEPLKGSDSGQNSPVCVTPFDGTATITSWTQAWTQPYTWNGTEYVLGAKVYADKVFSTSEPFPTEGCDAPPTKVAPKPPVVKDKCESANDHYGLPDKTEGITYSRDGKDILATVDAGYTFDTLPAGWTADSEKVARYPFSATEWTSEPCSEQPDDRIVYGEWGKPVITCENEVGDEVPFFRNVTSIPQVWNGQAWVDDTANAETNQERDIHVVTEADIEALECVDPTPNPTPTLVPNVTPSTVPVAAELPHELPRTGLEDLAPLMWTGIILGVAGGILVAYRKLSKKNS